MDKLLEMTKAGACLSGLDPLFVAHVLQHRGAVDETNDHLRQRLLCLVMTAQQMATLVSPIGFLRQALARRLNANQAK